MLVVAVLLEPNPIPPYGWLFHAQLPEVWATGRVHSMPQLLEYVGLALAHHGHGGEIFSTDVVMLDEVIA